MKYHFVKQSDFTVHTRYTPRGIRLPMRTTYHHRSIRFTLSGRSVKNLKKKNSRRTEETDNETRIVRRDKRNKVRGKVAPLIEGRFEE